MALRDLIKKQGQLGRTSEEEVQSLSSAAGLSSTPTTPVGVASIGGSPDSAKMAGTPAAKTSALRLALRGQGDLATAQRQETVRKEASAEEQQAAQQAKGLQGLGGLQSRVQQLVDGMLNKAATTPVATQGVALNTKALETALQGQPDSAKAWVSQFLQRMGKGEAIDFRQLADLNSILGRTDVKDMLDEKQLKELFLTGTEQIQQQIAAGVPDTAKVGQLTPEQLQSLGYTDVQALAEVVGVDRVALSDMSVSQLREAVNTLESEKFDRTERVTNRAGDPNLGPAERAQARKQLREMGAVGTRTAEEDVDDLLQQIETADVISFGGEQYTVDKLLNDETVSGIVKKYLEEPEYAATLSETEPQFADWIDANKSALEKAAANIGAPLKQFADMQTANATIADMPTGTRLSDSVMSTIVPGWGKISATAIAPPAIINYLKSEPNPARALKVQKSLEDLTKFNPGYAQEFAKFDQGQLERLGMFGDGDPIGQFIDYNNTLQSLRDTNPDTDPDGTIRAIFGDKANYERMKTYVEDYTAMKNIGMGLDIEVPEEIKLLDPDGDGKLNDIAHLRSAFISKMGEGSEKGMPLERLLATGRKIQDIPTIQQTLGKLSEAVGGNKFRDLALHKLKGVGADGSITGEEAKTLTNRLSYDEMQTVLDNSKALGWDAKDVLRTALSDKALGIAKDLTKFAPGEEDIFNRLVSSPDTMSESERQFVNSYIQRADNAKGNQPPAVQNALSKIAWQGHAIHAKNSANQTINDLNSKAADLSSRIIKSSETKNRNMALNAATGGLFGPAKRLYEGIKEGNGDKVITAPLGALVDLKAFLTPEDYSELEKTQREYQDAFKKRNDMITALGGKPLPLPWEQASTAQRSSSERDRYS